MKRRTIFAAAIAMMLVLAWGSAVRADWFGERHGRHSKRDKRSMHDRERIRERIGLMMMWRLTDALDLDQETAAKLFPLVHEFDEQQRQLRETRFNIVEDMKAEVSKSNPDATALNQLIEKFKANEREMVEARIKRLERLSELLTEDQIAKMIVFVPEFERHVRDLVTDVRRRHRQGQGLYGGRAGGPPVESEGYPPD